MCVYDYHLTAFILAQVSSGNYSPLGRIGGRIGVQNAGVGACRVDITALAQVREGISAVSAEDEPAPCFAQVQLSP